MKAKLSFLLLAGILLVFAATWGASPGYGGESDHERARRALLAGEILSLRTVLDRVEQVYPGQAVKIEFEEDDGAYLYKIKLLQSTGTMVKLKVDARDGRIIGAKGRDIRPRGHD